MEMCPNYNERIKIFEKIEVLNISNDLELK